MSTGRICIAVLAMGGEGGGVLADWLVDLAEHNGYLAQATSVPGVAQRTGATVYYIELYPQAQVPRGALPVLALAPFPGEVDLVVASELMEAGRALQRGLVHAGRTTLVTSTHRVYSMAEKTALADGRVSTDKLLEGARAAAHRLVAANFADIAERCGTPIGASLFGAVAASGCLPFGRAQFEAAIERGGVGVAASLRAFSMGHDATHAPGQGSTTDPLITQPGRRLARHLERIEREFRPAAHAHLKLGVCRLADYQDPDYATDYLDRLARLQAACAATELTDDIVNEAARHLALWMSYEDVARVADLKVRRSRFERIHTEMRVQPDQLLQLHEYLHPRVEEIADALPAVLGRWLLASAWARQWISRRVAKGQIVQTTSVRGFVQLYVLAGLRRWRRGSLRFAVEQSRMRDWLEKAHACLPDQPALALEIVRTQQLIKGYSDTHQRGWQNYCTLMEHLPQLKGQAEAASRLAALRQAALADDTGQALQAALRTA